MDFTPNLCIISKSEILINQEIPILSAVPIEVLKNPSKNTIPEMKLVIDSKPLKDFVFDSNLCDQELYEKRNRLIPFQNVELSTDMIAKIIPFSRCQSIFKYQEAVQLANIDAIFQILPIYYGAPFHSINGRYLFCNVGDYKGGFCEYVNYRFPDNTTFGTTFKEYEYDREWLCKNRTNVLFDYYGPDGFGDIATIYNDFIKRGISNSSGYDFVSCNANIDRENKIPPDEKEIAFQKLIAAECLIGLKLTQQGRNFVLRVFDTVSTFSGQLLYLMGLAFEKTFLFKPISSDSRSEMKYLICMNALFTKETISSYIEQLIQKIKPDQQIISFLKYEEVPQIFLERLTEFNNVFLESQIEILEKIKKVENGEYIKSIEYDVSKIFSIWDIPNNRM